jgi:hypothetical protein
LKEKKMKFIVELNNTKILMTADQIDALTNLLWGAEQLTRKYVPSTATAPSTYINLIDTFNMLETLRLGAMAGEEYDAMVLITKLHNESNA